MFNFAHLTYSYLVGLRQAPPQRVLFQPDVSSSRQPRRSSSHPQSSPQPAAGVAPSGHSHTTSINPVSTSFNVANYEPRLQMPLTLRGVVTPGNNPSLFKERQRIAREAKAAQSGKVSSSTKGMMKPGGK